MDLRYTREYEQFRDRLRAFLSDNHADPDIAVGASC